MICPYCNSILESNINHQLYLMILCDKCNVFYNHNGRIFQIWTTIIPFKHLVCFHYDINKTEIWSVKYREEISTASTNAITINGILNINPHNIQQKLKLYLTML